MPPARLTPTSALAVACAGAAAWCSLCVLAMSDAGPRALRIGLLQPAWWLGAFVAGAVALAWAVRLQPGRARPLFASALLLVPWLPVRLPAAALIWTGPVVWLVWAAIAAAVLAAGAPAARTPAWVRDWVARPSRAPWIAFACAAMLYAGTAWRLAPLVPGGDEPHYLIIAQSLWRDGDLRIENNHQRGDYLEYFGGALRPDYLKRGTDNQIYSIHLPGVSAVVAPVLALGGYSAVKIFLALLSAAAASAAWRAAFALTGQVAAAWFGWAGVTLAAPVLLLSFTVYPDGPGAVVVMLAFALLVSLQAKPARPAHWWAGPGLLAALLPWFHPRFAVLAAALGAVFALRAMSAAQPLRTMAAFAAVPVASAIGWFGYYYAIYGRLDPSVAYGHYTQMSLGRAPTGLLGLLFDQQYGLLVYAPVFAVGLAGLVPLARRHPRLTAEWVAVVAPYAIVTAMYHMWWGGFSSPARFIGATLPLFALPIAGAWAYGPSTATRAFQAAALGVTAGIAAMLVAVEHGSFVFNVRGMEAPWLAWASQAADLTRAVPSVFRHGPATAIAEVAVWTAAILSAWGVCHVVARRARLTAGPTTLVGLLLLGAAAAAAAAVNWRIEGVSGMRPMFGQLRALDAAAAHGAARAVLLDVRTSVPVAEAFERVRIGAGPGDDVGGERSPVLPYLPAGRYRLWADLPRAGAFEVALFGGRADGPFLSWRVAAVNAGAVSQVFDLPVGVSAVLPQVNADAESAVRGMWLQPDWEGWRPGPAAGRRAASARRYGGFVVYAIAGAWLEPDGLWTAGGRISELVVQAPAGETQARFTLRAGPVATPLYVAAGDFELKSVLAPGEVRELELPLSANGSARVLIHAVQGFRPSETEPGSADRRLLGVRLDQNRTTPPK
jgi:hypothetical protein